jgi:hypothetical protein
MKIGTVAWIVGAAVAVLDIYLFATMSGDLGTFVLLPSLLFAVVIGTVSPFLRRRRPRTVMLAGLFAWLLFILGTLAFIACCGAYFPSSFGNFNFDGIFYSFIAGGIAGLVGFCGALACGRHTSPGSRGEGW